MTVINTQNPFLNQIDSLDESYGSLLARTRVVIHAYNNQHQIAEGYLLCLQNSLPQESSGDLQHALEAIRRANRLTQMMAENALSEELILNVSELNMMLSRFATSLGISNELFCPNEEDLLLMVKGDSRLNYQAVISLVENGCEASTDASELKLSSEVIHLDRASDQHDCYLGPGSYLQINIQDNGRGMTEPLLAESQNLFCSTKSSEHGVGVGLPLARSVAERNGGALVLESHEGIGTNACLYFSLA